MSHSSRRLNPRWSTLTKATLGLLVFSGGCSSTNKSEPSVAPEAKAIPQVPATADVQTSDPNSSKGAVWSIEQTFNGRIEIPMTIPGEIPSKLSPQWIRDQKAFDAFVAMIPRAQITKKSPAPPSDDPLLSLSAINFETSMLIVAFRTDTMYVYPTLDTPRLAGATLLVNHANPPLGDTAHAAARQGVGTYSAILVKRHDGQIELVSK